MLQAVSTLYRVRLLALQPLSAGNSTEFSEADNLKTMPSKATNLASLDSLGSCESISVHFKPNYGTPITLDTHPPEQSSPWNTHPPGTPIPLKLPPP